MKKLPSMVDMSMDNEEKQEWAESISAPVPPKYPYGLSISLTEKELDKLGIEASDIEIGDMLHLHALAKATSVSCHDNEHGSTCRVELQICYLSGEDEEEENEEAESVTSRLYRK